jgi:dephospho-CoA kinase
MPAVAVEAIKLVEGGLAALCDEVWLLVCDPAAQRERLAARTPDATDTEARIAAQADIVERLLPSSTRVIDTSGTLDETRALVRAAFVEAVSAANAGPSPAASSMPPPSPRSSGL